MKRLLAVVILVAGPLIYQTGCRWPCTCCVKEPAACTTASEWDQLPRAESEGVHVAERPVRQDASAGLGSPTPYDRGTFETYDPAASLPPAQPLSTESSVLR